MNRIKTLTALLITLMLAACTHPQPVVQVPTLAVLPSETATGTPPTSTYTPQPTVTPTPTLSPVPSDTSTLTSTPLPPCDMAGWWKTVNSTITQFFDTADVADATPHDNLAPVLLQMQQTFRSFQALPTSDCAQSTDTEIADGMDNLITAFEGILSQNDETTSTGLLLSASHFWTANQILTAYGIAPDNRMTKFSWGGYPMIMNAAGAMQLAQIGATGIVATFDAATSIAIDAQSTSVRATLRADDPVFAGQLDTQDTAFGLTMTAIVSPSTPTPTLTLTPTLTPTPTMTFSSQMLGHTSNSHSYYVIYMQPNDNSGIVATTRQGIQVAILGQTADGLWLYIELSNGKTGWLDASSVVVDNP